MGRYTKRSNEERSHRWSWNDAVLETPSAPKYQSCFSWWSWIGNVGAQRRYQELAKLSVIKDTLHEERLTLRISFFWQLLRPSNERFVTLQAMVIRVSVIGSCF
ncbi:Secondary metabolism regulator LAE1 [Fusarium oxysporum f. sp. albedinis]|nr:Secondary metabolism regulator LAE1 [Fusarium oxysporum f. sp. albedinis]